MNQSRYLFQVANPLPNLIPEIVDAVTALRRFGIAYTLDRVMNRMYLSACDSCFGFYLVLNIRILLRREQQVWQSFIIFCP